MLVAMASAASAANLACTSAETPRDAPAFATGDGAAGSADGGAHASDSGALHDATTHNVHDGGAHDAHAADADGSSHGHGACGTVGRTGAGTACTFFARCGNDALEIDCRAGDGTCICRPGDASVAYQPVFCEVPDGGDPYESFDRALAAGHTACGWPAH